MKFRMMFGVAAFVSAMAWPGSAWAQFQAEYPEVSNPDFAAIQAEMKAEQAIENLAAVLNEALVLPTEVSISFEECDTSNAFYNPEQQAIVMCFELLEEMYEGALEAGYSDEEAETAAFNVIMFFFYHEVGHALVDVLDLPITGREEDAVDQLSMYALSFEQEGAGTALDAAHAFMAWAQEREEAGGEAIVWGEHSLSEQRYFNIVCWVFGQDPDRFRNLIADGLLPEDRAARCPAEWARIDSSWTTLLEDYLR